MALVPIARDSTTSVVSLTDPAIDWDRSVKPDETPSLGPSPVLKYQTEQSRRPSSWRELLVFKDGATPTEFIIGVIPPSALVRIEDETGIGTAHAKTRELCWRAFLAGVRDIRGMPVLGGGAVPKKTVDGIEYVDPEWLAKTFAGPLLIVAREIGFVAWQWQQMTRADEKNS